MATKQYPPGVRACESCGKRVLFAVDEKGTRQVLDIVAPVYAIKTYRGYEGTDPDTEGLTAIAEVRDVARERLAFVSHFATCPNAARHSSKRKAPVGAAEPTC